MHGVVSLKLIQQFWLQFFIIEEKQGDAHLGTYIPKTTFDWSIDWSIDWLIDRLNLPVDNDINPFICRYCVVSCSDIANAFPKIP